jgi:very-short-patch-repair endonuclease
MSSPDGITKRKPGKTTQARRLRHDGTDEEHQLWRDLRNRQLNGHKIVRQVPIGPYVADFLCRRAHLIIEIDGFHHANDRGDERRTGWLNENGNSVLRFWNHEITRERHSVLETILAAVEGRIFERDDVLRFHPVIDRLEDNR